MLQYSMYICGFCTLFRRYWWFGIYYMQYATKLPDLLSLLKFPGEVRALLIPQIGPVDQ